MKRKFKQWWSTIPPISTKLTIYYHLSPQIIECKKHHDNGVENHIIEFSPSNLFIFFVNYVSPSNEGRHIVLVCFFSAKLVRTITFLSFQIGQLYLVCGCMTIRWCVAYRNDLRGTLTFDLKVNKLFFK